MNYPSSFDGPQYQLSGIGPMDIPSRREIAEMGMRKVNRVVQSGTNAYFKQMRSLRTPQADPAQANNTVIPAQSTSNVPPRPAAVKRQWKRAQQPEQPLTKDERRQHWMLQQSQGKIRRGVSDIQKGQRQIEHIQRDSRTQPR